MQINVNDIFDFFNRRVKCHVESVNYFAGLLGYHFPEHDSDKIIEPIRTGYAYIFYQTYHKNFHPTHEHELLCQDAINIHHATATHHVQHYKHVSEIPPIRIYEIVSDWASANFEQQNILHYPESVDLPIWFQNKMAHLEWTDEQMDIFKKSFEIFREKTDQDQVKAIWQPLLEDADI